MIYLNLRDLFVYSVRYSNLTPLTCEWFSVTGLYKHKMLVWTDANSHTHAPQFSENSLTCKQGGGAAERGH